MVTNLINKIKFKRLLKNTINTYKKTIWNNLHTVTDKSYISEILFDHIFPFILLAHLDFIKNQNSILSFAIEDTVLKILNKKQRKIFLMYKREKTVFIEFIMSNNIPITMPENTSKSVPEEIIKTVIELSPNFFTFYLQLQ